MFCDDIPTGNVAKLEECSECSDDVWRDKPFDGIQIHLWLENLVSSFERSTMSEMYLHQSLGIIPGPLIKIPALFELT